MENFSTKNEVNTLIDRGISLQEVSDELDYRDTASLESRWNDNLAEYSTDELVKIEVVMQAKLYIAKEAAL